MKNDKQFILATLPASAVAVLLMGIANNHPNAGTVTHTLFALVVLAFCVQVIMGFRRA